MGVYKGIAVSIHSEGSPLPEYGIQRFSKQSKVNTFVPVPKAKLSADGSTRQEPAKFAISITLLTSGQTIPYSQAKATPDNPYPTSQTVSPNNAYKPLTTSPNETIAAYIYFDGRSKEEVATLLRPGEETWVNSRWVQVLDSEGGGLAEREFLFREVGLERWLNGLDLDGQDATARIEKRRQKFEKRRRRRREEDGSDDDMEKSLGGKGNSRAVLRYGDDEHSPVEKISDDDDGFSTDESDDDAPPEAAGQIKVAMFRVLASGEIKRGEYSPQFDAHDDEEDGKGEEADIDHTTSFAKPKTLDPKSISTQTVTGIDGPDKPFAVFTFFYRGEKQLQKMGIVSPKQSKNTPSSAKRRSTQLDFSGLAPLKSTGTVGFSSFRDSDPSARPNKTRKKRNGSMGGSMAEDSDEDDDEAEMASKMHDVDEKEEKDGESLLSPEDAKFSGELADGVGRIKLKRQHSAEQLNANTRKSPSVTTTSIGTTTPPMEHESSATSAPQQLLSNNVFGKLAEDSDIGSPLKKHRASVYEMGTENIQKRLDTGFGNGLGGSVPASAEAVQTPLPATTSSAFGKDEMEEEL